MVDGHCGRIMKQQDYVKGTVVAPFHTMAEKNVKEKEEWNAPKVIYVTKYDTICIGRSHKFIFPIL